MILIPSVDGHEVKLYESLDAQVYLGVSATTLSRWRRDGWIASVPLGRGFVYTQEALEECNELRRFYLDRKNKGVEYAL